MESRPSTTVDKDGDLQASPSGRKGDFGPAGTIRWAHLRATVDDDRADRAHRNTPKNPARPDGAPDQRFRLTMSERISSLEVTTRLFAWKPR